jgi:hypothetical protein
MKTNQLWNACVRIKTYYVSVSECSKSKIWLLKNYRKVSKWHYNIHEYAIGFS